MKIRRIQQQRGSIRANLDEVKAAKVKVGSLVTLTDEGIETVSGFVRTREDAEKLLKPMRVLEAFPVPIDDVPGFLSITLDAFPDCLIDNTQVTTTKY